MDVYELLVLRNIKGVGDRALVKIQRAFPTTRRLLPPDPQIWVSHRLITADGARSLEDGEQIRHAEELAHQTLDKAKKLGIRIICLADTDYPPLLKLLENPPPLLFIKGSLAPLSKSVAVIGTREPTQFGIKVARLCSRAIAEAGWVVTSGLAKGIDAVAHRGAVEAGGKTVAVMANGLDSVYPREHAELAERILETGGALISEQDIGAKATSFNLVQRDRLQSGLSAGTLVCETDIKGGSMHTARFTKVQDRALFCPVPKPPFDNHPKSRGLSYLIASGAVAIDGHESIHKLLSVCQAKWDQLISNPHQRSTPRIQETFLNALSTIEQATPLAGTGSSPELPSTLPNISKERVVVGDLTVEWDSTVGCYQMVLGKQPLPEAVRSETIFSGGGRTISACFDSEGVLVGLRLQPITVPNGAPDSKRTMS